MPENFPSHLPFIDAATLSARAEAFLRVQEDPIYGLRTPGRSGYVINDGPGSITVRVADDGERWSKAETINSGELAQYEHLDDVWIHTVHIVADAAGASFRAKFVRQSPD
ncbi:MAG: hypothetical protein U9Q68_03820 [Euryarchaeota archaeon]|nr:hypothetical protein [Euryarchaeota archaeon]